MTRRNNRGLALWAKILIGIGILCVLVTLAIGGTIWYFVSDAMNPESIAKVAQKICKIEALPPGLKYKAGKDLMGFCFVAASAGEGANEENYIVVSTPIKGRVDESASAEKMISSIKEGKGAIPNVPSGAGGAASTDATSASSSNSKLQVKGEGSMDVGTDKMFYVYGTPIKIKADGAEESTNSASFIGAVNPAGQDRLVTVVVMQANKADLDMEKVKAFVSAMKGF